MAHRSRFYVRPLQYWVVKQAYHIVDRDTGRTCEIFNTLPVADAVCRRMNKETRPVNKDRYSVKPEGNGFAIVDSQTGKQIEMFDTLPAADAICKMMNDHAMANEGRNKGELK